MKKFCDLNWVLQEVADFKSTFNQDITKSHLTSIITNAHLGGRVTNIPNLYDLLITKLKLCIPDGYGRIHLTHRGHGFLKLNNSKSYELNQSQKALLSSWYISIVKGNVCKLMDCFKTFGHQYCCAYEVIPKVFRQTVEELKYLGIFIFKEDNIYISPEFWWLISCDANTLSQDELFDILEKQKEIGSKAERIVYEVEVERLKRIGLNKASDKVRIISDTHVNAGYDILSFSSSSEFYDRFIEVKCIDSEFTFYWTENEMRIAAILKELYFLYLVQDIYGETKIWAIQNPLKKRDCYSISYIPTQYRSQLSVKDEQATICIENSIINIIHI